MTHKIAVPFIALLLFAAAPAFAVSVDLKAVRAKGEKRIRAMVAEVPSIEGVFFRDGASAYDTSTPNDFAAIFVVAKISAATEIQLAYVAKIQAIMP